MGISLRASKASPLTHVELDGNWQLWTGVPLLKTIATGAIAATVTYGSGAGRYRVSAETGTSDDLDSITGTADGDMVILFATAGHTITVRHNAAGGNFRLEGGLNFTLNSIYDHMILWNVGGSILAGKGVNVPE